jgi:hypothetical protein
MAQITGATTYHNSPRYEGLIWTADAEPGRGTGTPFLTLMGGLNSSNMRVVPDWDYAMTAVYDYPTAAQPDVDENTAQNAPNAISPVFSQVRNAVNMYHEAVNVTYKKLSTMDRLATDIVIGGAVGYWAPEGDPVQDAIQERKTYILRMIARNFNVSCLRGAYQQSTDSDTASKTRGVVTAVTTNAVAANGAELTESMLQEVFADVALNSNGQGFMQVPILFAPTLQKQNITKIYGKQPESWDIGGMNITIIMTDFGEVGVVYEPMVQASNAATDTIAFVAMNACRPVFNPVITESGNAGLFLYEDLAKTGAGYKGQFVAHMGIDYANEKLHGKITGIAQSRI